MAERVSLEKTWRNRKEITMSDIVSEVVSDMKTSLIERRKSKYVRISDGGEIYVNANNVAALRTDRNPTPEDATRKTVSVFLVGNSAILTSDLSVDEIIDRLARASS